MECLAQIRGRLTCLCGTEDPLIPPEDRAAIQAALLSAEPSASRFRYVEMQGADHGFMCEARNSFDLQASTLGWQLLLEDL